MKKLIYIADDEKNIRNLIASFLIKEGYEICQFENGDVLYDAFINKSCDLVILDVMMPGSSGFVICAKLRAISDIPIIMLTARDTDEDYITGISLGSDDYFTKPVSPLKITTKVNAIFRRQQTKKENTDKVLVFFDLQLSRESLIVICQNIELNLTNTEFNFLAYLMENNEKAISREELLTNVWGYDTIIETRATDDTVKRLRKKLLNAGSEVSIETIWGFGFRLVKK
ncbi:MAG: response regulator transcription factor [Defluviitaleaceae bacterium]|nr:response regulator transcription factor [Defluviitaleaceae bacterium]